MCVEERGEGKGSGVTDDFFSSSKNNEATGPT